MESLLSFEAWSLSRIIEFLIACNNDIDNVCILYDDIHDNDSLLMLLLVINNIFFKYRNYVIDECNRTITIDECNRTITIVVCEKEINYVRNYIDIVTNHIHNINMVHMTSKLIISSSIPNDSNYIIDINPKSNNNNMKTASLYETIMTSPYNNDTSSTNRYQVTIHCPLSKKDFIIIRSNDDKEKSALELSIDAFRNLLICADYSFLFPDLVPILQKKKNTKLVFEGSDKLKSSNGNCERISVWTEPGPSSSLDYLLALLRVSKYSIFSYISIIPVLKEKMLYLRNCSFSRQLEVVEALELVFYNGLAYECCIRQETRSINSTSSTNFQLIVENIARFIVGIDSHHNEKTNNLSMRVLQIARSAIIVYPFDIAINLILARCLSITGLSSSSSLSLSEARDVYTRILTLNEDNSEAKAGLEDVSVALSNIENDDSSNNTNPSTTFKKLNLWMKISYLTKKKANIDNGYKLIENDVKLCESVIWQLQRNFYSKKGLEAWGRGDEQKVDIVPFFITSNSMIAREYSRIIFCALVDLHRLNKLVMGSPIYIAELGAGHAKFSIIFVRMLSSLLHNSGLSQLKVIHIISDFTSVNFEDISNYSDIKEYLVPLVSHTNNKNTSNVLIDFAVFDGDTDDKIHLIRSNLEISRSNPTANPLFVIGNYIFDSLVMNAYKVVPDSTGSKTILHEGRLTTFLKETDNETNLDELTSMDLHQRCNLLWSYNNKVDTDHSSDNAKINYILEYFSKSLSPGVIFTIPVGGLNCLEKLNMLTSSKILVTLLADKGYNRIALLEEHDEDPAIAQHGSLSMMVNILAAGEYAKIDSSKDTIVRNGFARHSTQRNSPLDVSLLCSGVTNLPLCESTFELGFEIGIHDVFVLRDHCEDIVSSKNNDSHDQNPKIETICVLSELAAWDADVIFQFGKAIQLEIFNFKKIDDKHTKQITESCLRYIYGALKFIEFGIVDQFDVRTESRSGLKKLLLTFEENDLNFI